MPSALPQFTVRVDPELLKKFRYVAEFNARSANREADACQFNPNIIIPNWRKLSIVGGK